MFQVDLKTLLGLVLPNQYCHVIVRKNCGRFLGYIISRIAPTPLMSLIYSTIVLYDTTAARDFADIYTQSPRATGPRTVGVYVSKIPSSRRISDIYCLGRTHLIGERTNGNSSHLFYTVASEDRS